MTTSAARALLLAWLLATTCLAGAVASPGNEDAREQHREALLHDRLAGVACDRGLWDVAINEWHEAARLEPTWSRPYLGMARAYERQGQLSLALMAIRQATRHAPRDPLAWFNQGWLEWKGGSAVSARTAFYHVLALQPAMAPPVQELGAAYATPGLRAHLYLAALEHAAGNHALAAYHLRRSLLAPARLNAGLREAGAVLRLYHQMLTPAWTSDGQELHLAACGPALFRVRTPDGDAYTPSLALRLNDTCTEVITVEGWRLYLKGRLGATLVQATLAVRCSDGRLLDADGREIGAPDVAWFARPWKLRPRADGLLVATEESGPAQGTPPPGQFAIGVGLVPQPGFAGIPLDEVQDTLDLVCGLLESPTLLAALEQPQDAQVLRVLPQLQAAWAALPHLDARDRARLASAIDMGSAGALHRLGRQEEATRRSQAAAAATPDNAYAIYNVGYLLDLRGRPREARPYLERALAMAVPPADHSLLVGRASFLLGRQALQRGELAEAQRRLEKALVTLPPPLVEPLGLLMRLEMQRGRPMHALILGLEALERARPLTRSGSFATGWRPELEPDVVRHVQEDMARLGQRYQGLGNWVQRALARGGPLPDVPAEWLRLAEGDELSLYVELCNHLVASPPAPGRATPLERCVQWALRSNNVLARSLAYQACLDLAQVSTDPGRSHLATALTLFPQASESLLAQAWRLESLQRGDEALGLLDQALRIAKAPPAEAAYCLPSRAMPVSWTTDGGGSRSICPEDLGVTPSAPRLASMERVQHARGHLLLRSGNVAGALEAFRASQATLRIAGDDSSLGWSLKADLMRTLARQGHTAEAAEAAEQLLLTASPAAMYTVGGTSWRVLAESRLAAGRPHEALEWLRRYVAWIMGNGWAMTRLSIPPTDGSPNPWRTEWLEVKALFEKAGVRAPAPRPPKPAR